MNNHDQIIGRYICTLATNTSPAVLGITKQTQIQTGTTLHYICFGTKYTFDERTSLNMKTGSIKTCDFHTHPHTSISLVRMNLAPLPTLFIQCTSLKTPSKLQRPRQQSNVQRTTRRWKRLAGNSSVLRA